MKWMGLGLLAICSNAWAQPQWIRFGYTQCTACHIAPQGGGFLSDYGKSIAASESFFAKDLQAEAGKAPEKRFFGMESGLLARGMLLTKGAETGSSTSLFPMQLDYLNQIQIGDFWHTEMIIGYLPARVVDPTQKNFLDNFIVRRATLHYRLREDLEFSLGRDFLPIGTNTPDHSLYIRSLNRRGVTDYQSLFSISWFPQVDSVQYQVTPFAYLPSFQESSANQESGGGFQLERSLGERSSIAVGALYGQTQAISRWMVAPQIRAFFNEQFGMMAEVDFTRRTVLDSNTSFWRQTGMFDPIVVPLTGLEIHLPLEYTMTEDPFLTSSSRIGLQGQARIQRWVSVLVGIGRELHFDDSAETVFQFQLIGSFL